ncbi:peptidase [Culex quinquefasciatus]|uniref:Peptidase n=1 Tax=Culex quinquefasciatus TaxID=7176 RepID=B0X5G3_CULQU|nr:peptidase [Culex quinquefasciatus]|eukprot:XP_001864885.1 peptidase [Culex quinquefasciatus]
MADDKIEKLNDQNFEIWKFRMELKLTKEKLIKVVLEPKPRLKPVAGSGQTEATGDQTDAAAAGVPAVSAAEMAAWLEKDGEARHAIGMAVENDQLVHICRKKTAKEMWDTLLGIHEVESMNTMMTVMQKMCSLKLQEDGNLPEHLKKLTAMHNRLEVADEGLKPRQFVAVILSSLPMSYGTLINVIEGYPREQITVDFVKSKLRDEWRRRQECQEFQSGPSDEKALKISAKSGSRAKPKAAELKKKKSGVCHFCQEEGHFIRDCPVMAEKRKEVMKSDAKRGSAKVNLAAEVHSEKEVLGRSAKPGSGIERMRNNSMKTYSETNW